MRELCIILSRNTYTPVNFWLDVRLRDIVPWIKANNKVIKEVRDSGKQT